MDEDNKLVKNPEVPTKLYFTNDNYQEVHSCSTVYYTAQAGCNL